ncbi:polyketide synthase [Ktedonobacter robiniae]|uniref:Polyketide synthase n=2 Tax=Ktedonobacter robiniae TaxID=2778365 RepID=A0ABQ3V4M1_9CHLR|nr:polyketide synthase [Ktedonobacter robiniae]
MHNQHISDSDIAIIGLHCRVPGANTADEFWRNLREGVESISYCSDEQLRSTLAKSLGYVPEEVVARWTKDAKYVRAAAALEDIDLFDAAFFGYSATEAEILDPQQRLFLECSWAALEDAGYTPESSTGLVGVYGGSEVNAYHGNAGGYTIMPAERDLLSVLGAESGYLTTRVSYKLNLKGPSFNVQSACSTSLVAIHAACQGLKNGECDMALAGGVTAYTTQQVGYLYQEGSMFSPDGHCRPFDAQARGTVFAMGGMGVIVLKRLSEALEDRDHIYAIIKGSAINNDGSIKTGYTAPSVDGQVRVIMEALAAADVSADTISYIEAHGTATQIGDPIEIAALTQAFQRGTQRKQFCAVGSVKSNIGHLGAAAGVASIIKTTQALRHRQIPPSLHYKESNPQINFPESPFYVNTVLSDWQTTDDIPRRAGVSSFGIGGTNAHIVMQEAPEVEEAPDASRPWQVLLLSARTEEALERMKTNLKEYLQTRPAASLADLAFTLQTGRKRFAHRYALVCDSASEAVRLLEEGQGYSAEEEEQKAEVAFLFSGQGAQYSKMALELYQCEPVFRTQVDQCAQLLKPHLGFDLRALLYPASSQQEVEASQRLNQTYVTQPALFVIEYAMAQLWMKWGLKPGAMIGHSIGEYVAACLAGVFTLEEALALVALRGRLMQELPAGAMTSVPLPEREVRALLGPQLSIAACNSLSDCVVSGPFDAVEQLERKLQERDILCRRLHTSHAFHSQMMDPMLERFTAEVRKIHLRAPKIPYISNVTGTWITNQEATRPEYWAQHLRQTVRFADGLQTLLQSSARVLLELGPGRSLVSFVKRHPAKRSEHTALPSLRHPQDSESDLSFLLHTCGRLWSAGVKLNWTRFHNGEQRQRLSLPTYPFERKRYWKYPQRQYLQSGVQGWPTKEQDVTRWFSVPSWKRSLLSPTLVPQQAGEDHPWVIFTDEYGTGAQLARCLEEDGETVITVKAGDAFSQLANRLYTVQPGRLGDYEALFTALDTLHLQPARIVHLWSIIPEAVTGTDWEQCDSAQERGFYSLLFIAQALGKHNITHPVQISVITNHLQEVMGGEVYSPVRATVFGPGKVISHEYSQMTCHSIDVDCVGEALRSEWLAAQLATELRLEKPEVAVAYRNRHRWVQTTEPVALEPAPEESIMPLRQRGVYLITGGLGGVGLVLAEHLARTVQARLVLLGRGELPRREDWEAWLATHSTDERSAQRIRSIQALEEAGAEVLPVSADVTDEVAMRQVLAQAERRFGQLHGVIHAAGVVDVGIIQLKAPEAAARVLAPKVRGTLVLDRVVQDIPLDFIVLCSSLYSVIGGTGQVDYCAANAFLDCYAFYNTARRNVATLSINWDAWQEVGMAVDTGNGNGSTGSDQAEASGTTRRGFLPKDGILSREGVEAFQRILQRAAFPQVMVSTRNLQEVQQRMQHPSVAHIEEDEVGTASAVHSRPNIKTSYVEPRNSLEQHIADIWQRVIGIDKVGTSDNFFDLGGDSVMIMQVLKRLYDICQVELSVHVFFEYPTVESLANTITQRQMEALDGAQVETLLQSVDQLSEEEVALLLGQQAAE